MKLSFVFLSVALVLVASHPGSALVQSSPLNAGAKLAEPSLRGITTTQNGRELFLSLSEIIEAISNSVINAAETVQELQDKFNELVTLDIPQVDEIAGMFYNMSQIPGDLFDEVVDAARQGIPMSVEAFQDITSNFPDVKIPAVLVFDGFSTLLNSIKSNSEAETFSSISSAMTADTPQVMQTTSMLNTVLANENFPESSARATAEAVESGTTVDDATLADLEEFADEGTVPASISIPGAATLIWGLKSVLSPANAETLENLASSITPQAIQVLNFLNEASGLNLDEETIAGVVGALSNTAVLTFEVFSDLTSALPDDITVPASLTVPSYSDLVGTLQSGLSSSNVDLLDGAITARTPQLVEIFSLLASAVGVNLSDEEIEGIISAVQDGIVLAGTTLVTLGGVLPSDIDIPASLSIEGAASALSDLALSMWENGFPDASVAQLNAVMTSSTPQAMDVLGMLTEGISNGMPSSLVDTVTGAVGTESTLNEQDVSQIEPFLTTTTIPSSLLSQPSGDEPQADSTNQLPVIIGASVAGVVAIVGAGVGGYKYYQRTKKEIEVEDTKLKAPTL